MSPRSTHFAMIFLILAALVSGCQPVHAPVAGEAPPTLEEIKAHVLELDNGTFDHLMAHDVAAADAETSQDFIFINSQGVTQGHDEYVVGVADEKLSLDDPIWGEPELVALSPDAIMLVRTLKSHGTYDGAEISAFENLTSIWAKRDGIWLNVFLQATPVVEAAAVASTTEESSQGYPDKLTLPNMFQPEGIAISSDGTAYVGSISTGSIYQIDLRTGEGKMLVGPQEGQGVAGLAYDERTGYLYAAGITNGNALVFDTATGELVQDVQFVEEGGLVNDVTLTDRAVYFSESFKPAIYKLALDADGQLTEPLEATTIPLSGEYEWTEGALNANGIVAMNGGEYLIVALTDSGRLYRVDPTSGEATQIELDSEILIYHDGLAADGDTLYIINYNDRVYVVQMEPDGTSGKLIRAITDPGLDAITTAARYEDSLYVVNARWDTDLTPDIPYWITRVDRSAEWSITTVPVEEQIANAMGAAPRQIAQDATIWGFPVNEGDDMVLLREGSNGWNCLTDWPISPDNDPACYDPVFSAWNDAYMAGTEPEISGPGIAYMLGGGSDPSNSDPMAMEPAPGEKWIATMPHVMLIMPDGFDPAVFSTDPHSGFPYIMWEGTPYEHLMIPVVAQSSLTTKPLAPTATAEEQIQNMKGAAPTAIIAGATLMGYATEEGGEMIVLQEGTNGWVCHPDGQPSPLNDPSCDDAITSEGFNTGTTREVPQPGISYMLSGGSDPSNVDPNASEPAPGEHWVTTPSHIMLMVPGGFDVANFSADHMSGYPYIMFDDTNVEHLMIPLAELPAE